MAIEKEQPIEPVLRELMNDIGRILHQALKEETARSSERYGFALLMFGLSGDESCRMNYICDCSREDMLAALKEFIARNGGPTSRILPGNGTRRPALLMTTHQLRFVETLEEALELRDCCYCDRVDWRPVAATLLGLLPIPLRIGVDQPVSIGWTVLCTDCLQAFATSHPKTTQK